MGVEEIRAYLSYLAVEKNVAASTQNVARNALLFLYKKVLEIDLPFIDKIETAKRPERVPVVLILKEMQAILANFDGVFYINFLNSLLNLCLILLNQFILFY